MIVAFTILRLVFIWMNSDFFPELSMGELFEIAFFGIRFDLSTLVYCNVLFILGHLIPHPFRGQNSFQLFLKFLFLLINLPLILIGLIDMKYFQFSLKRSTIEVFGFGEDALELGPTIITDYWYITLLFLVFSAVVWFVYNRISKIDRPPILKVSPQLIILILGILLAGVLARGGFQLKPIGPLAALEYTSDDLAPLISNTPFEMMHSLGKNSIAPRQYFSEKQLKTHFRFCKSKTEYRLPPIISNNSEQAPNVMIIVLESFSQEFMGCYGAEVSYTPFLDSLARSGLVFENMKANGKRSVDGIPAIFAAIPLLHDEYFMNSIYQANKIEGLGTCLKRIGYETAFFHGGRNGTFNFDLFLKSAGFEKYYGQNEFNDDSEHDGNWGIWDEPFFQYTKEELDNLNEPFCAGLFSLTSHHPYNIPREFESYVAHVKSELEKSVLYTDFALKQFFNTASQSKWFQNTLFIITADHTGQAQNKFYNTRMGMFNIPLIVYHPTNNLAGRCSLVVQQLDIMPGVLDLTGYTQPFCALGESFLRPTEKRYAFHYIRNAYMIHDEKFALIFNGEKATRLFDYQQDPWFTKNVIADFPKDKIRLANKMKAYIQTYELALVKNEMSYED